ncbi:hypothetical protein HOG98_00190 [bacterium]|jgi:K(+)-stimulated pyrophosphate-energized sodium pump|nr:hypothetical protein [bacterium]
MFISQDLLIYFGIGAGLLSLLYSFVTRVSLSNHVDCSSAKDLTQYIKDGATAFFKQQMKIILIPVFLLSIFFYKFHGLGGHHMVLVVAFIWGCFWSGFSAFIGMKICSNYIPKVVQSAKSSFGIAASVSLKVGRIYGFLLVGMVLLDFSALVIVVDFILDKNWLHISDSLLTDTGAGYAWSKEIVSSKSFIEMKIGEISYIALAYCFGVSIQSVFIRVGGGLFTKISDVASDIFGKNEAGLSENDVRNPIVISDLVGDQVNNIGGVGVGIYQVITLALFSVSAIGSVFAHHQLGEYTPEHLFKLPFFLLGVGVVAAMISYFFLSTKNVQTKLRLKKSLSFTLAGTGLLIVVFMGVLGHLELLGWKIISPVIVGVFIAILLEQWTVYFTFSDSSVSRSVAASPREGDVLPLLRGMGNGFLAILLPVVLTTIGIISGFFLFDGVENVVKGFYGISLVGVGVASLLPCFIINSIVGPVNDNAFGCASMLNHDEKIIERTKRLDDHGNVTSGVFKMIENALTLLCALPLVIIFFDYFLRVMREAGLTSIIYVEGHGFTVSEKLAYAKGVYFIPNLSVNSLLDIFDVRLLNPYTIAGFLGGFMLFSVITGIVFIAVSNGATLLIREARRQIEQDQLIMEGESLPKYESIIVIAAKYSQKWMLVPLFLSCISPFLVGSTLGVAGTVGFLMASLFFSFCIVSIFLITGVLLDSAKNRFEAHEKGTVAHRAVVIADSFGDVLKDSVAPILMTLVKITLLISILLWPLVLVMKTLLSI